jgi:hypothetical protein
MPTLAAPFLVLLVAPLAAELLGGAQQPMPLACYSLSYQPESLANYVPVKVQLFEQRFQNGSRARFQVTPGARPALSLLHHASETARWRQDRDTLEFAIAFPVTGPPYWRVALGPLQHTTRAGTVYFTPENGEPVPDVHGTVQATLVSCQR